MRPFQQGDLDGLCGVYSVLNAIKILGYRDDVEGWQAILTDIFEFVKESKDSTDFLTDGISTPYISRVLGHIICINHNIKYSKPFHNKSADLSMLWDTIFSFLNTDFRRTAILCVDGHDYSHWSVVHSISKKRITLFDSDTMTWLNRGQCTTLELAGKKTALIHPSSLFLLERK